MKRCLACNTHFESSLMNCPACGDGPALVDGFYAYAPEYSHGGGGFKSHYFADLVKLEEKNFWFRSRNQLIAWALKKYSPGFRTFLEIGCGTGYVLSGIAKAFPHAILHGSEIFTAGLDFSSARLPTVDFLQMDARNIPYHEEFDVVGAFDVLEHIMEDEAVLEQICFSLRPKGVLLITVPQHMWLWSATDEYACHVRRYTATEIHQKIESAGFKISRTTSFVTTLLPAMMISRFLQRKSTEEPDVSSELKIYPLLNYFFYHLLRIELKFIKMGLSFPIGGSRLVVAKKI